MFKFLTKLDYLLKETFVGLRRGGWMNWAAVSTVTVLLFLFGMSLQSSWQLEKLLNQFGSQLELSVYLKPGVTAQVIAQQVTKISDVVDVKSVTKEQAWEKLVQELGISDIEGATAQLGNNPLVDELRVKASNSDVVPNLAMQLARIRGVDIVQYVDEAVKRVTQLHQGLNWISLSITVILTVTSIAVTTTTIRLIVMARRQEIEIMQLVGATKAWIYLPFILQGIAFGLTGGLVSWSLITLSDKFIGKLLANQPEFIQFLTNGLQLSSTQTILLPLILISFGSVVGVMGSLFAVQKFAKN
jgi:cell division transport system permease protein